MFISPSFAESENWRNGDEQKELENIQNFLYEAPITPVPEVKYVTNTSFGGDNDGTLKGMPMFKQMRIKITNYYKIKAHNDEIIQKEIDAQILREETGESAPLEEIQNKNLKPLVEKEQKSEDKEPKAFEIFRRKKFVTPIGSKTKDGEVKAVDSDTSKDDNEKEVSNETPQNQTIELQGGVKQVEAEKEVMLDCDIMNYLDESGEIEALGHPILVFPNQGVTLKSDRMTYNVATNVLKAFGNVELLRDGSTMHGDFMQVNMNEENAMMTNLKAKEMKMTITAKNANTTDDLVILEKGKMYAEDSFILRLQTQMIGARLDRMVIPESAQSHLDEMIGHTHIKVIAKDIKVVAKKEHDVVTAKKGTVYYGDKKLFSFPSFTAHTNKNHDYFEANYPEFGSRSRIGMFAGPGFVFDTPFASTVKVIPFLNYKNKFGFGGAVKYKSATNITDMMYGSAEDVFVLRGKQFLDDKLYFQYGMNSYMDDWWMGQRMAKYLAELVYRDAKVLPDFMGKNRALSFRHRVGAGYMQDSDVNRFDEKNMDSGEIGTTRFKYMAEFNQSLYHYNNPEKRLLADAGISLQGSAALYGTGDTQFVGRIGPYLHTQYKYWMQDLNYYMSAYSDQTPMPRFDMYRYGHSNVRIREAIRVNKYLTVAWSGSLNLSDDAPNGKMFQENAFIFAVGPDDFKLSLGYDFMREQTYFMLAMALDMKGSSIEYEKMEIKHPDKLGKDEKQYVKEITFENAEENVKPSKRVYAQVIEIEDPNKEQI